MNRIRSAIVAITMIAMSSILSIESAQAGLYAFTSHTFTPCGATGTVGPTTGNCLTAYSGATWTSNSSFFSTSSGIQMWVVPTTATYRITAYGAQGGTGYLNNAGGLGAKIQGDVLLTQGTQIKILVGQRGTTNTSIGGAGGGGGTFVATSSNSPIIVAGGGGGGGGDSAVGSKIGVDASTTTSGTAGRDGTVAGGTGGNGGGIAGSGWSGGSGGGMTGSGGPARQSSADIANSGGVAFTLGGTGGSRGSSYGTVGGFGGGGGASWAAGGGGGYSGGGSDYSDGAGTSREGAGGGGSYASGANQVLTASVQSGDGSVTIQILVGPPDAPTIGSATMLSPTTASVSFSAPSNNNGDTITAFTAISTPDSRTATINQSGSGSITITGLSPDTSYIFRVYATNSYGNSPYSSPSSSITTTRSPTSISISLPGNAMSTSYRTAVTITAIVVGTEGRVTFFLNSKRIAQCINRATSSLVATCNWLPGIHGNANVSAIFTPTSSAYLSSNTGKTFNVIARTNRR